MEDIMIIPIIHAKMLQVFVRESRNRLQHAQLRSQGQPFTAPYLNPLQPSHAQCEQPLH